MRESEKVKKILTELKKAHGWDFRYDHFAQGEAVPLPFIVYRRVAPTTFSADGKVYHHGQNVDIELYASDEVEMSDIMTALEEKLDEAEVYYRITADTAYIESEDFYESLYEI